jgi:hypothetical protein
METTSSPDKLKQELEVAEQKLKVEELELKIRDLKRPDYRRLNFWTSVFAIIIALGGLVAQNVLSAIKSEQAKLDQMNAEEQMKQALKKKDSATTEIAAAEYRLKVAQSDYAAIQAQLDSTKATLVQINKSVEALRTPEPGIAVSAVNNRQIEKIKVLTSEAQKELSSVRARVYIQITGEEQRRPAAALQRRLEASGYIVPGIENVAEKAIIPARTEVRYNRDEERDEAFRILQILKDAGLKVDVKDEPTRIPGSGKGTRAGHYEVWFSKT